jgi:hypothetical protein
MSLPYNPTIVLRASTPANAENGMAGSCGSGFEAELSQSELELLAELLKAVRTIRYGSVNLSFHDGRVVEIHKTERIRRSGKGKNE